MDPITLVLRASKSPPASAPAGGELSSAEIDDNWDNVKTACEQLDAEKIEAVRRFYGTTAPDPNLFDEWVFTTTGRVRRHDGTAWFEEPGIAGADGAPAVIAQAAVSVVPAKFGLADVSHPAVGVLPTNTVLCQLVPSADWDADDLSGLSVVGVAGTDSITFTITGPGPIGGDFSIAYQIG